MTRERHFHTDQHAAVHLIMKQAGTHQKALLENVMNAVDAGATRVDISVTEAGYEVRDDGRGFRTMSEIEDYFERFAFNHDGDALQSERTYGRFGIGRAQQWKYARCTYRSRTFQMDMDFQTHQLEYDLTRDLPDQPGTVITGVWYQRLTPAAATNIVRDLSQLVRYVPVPVFINRVQVSRDPTAEEWDIVTDAFYFRGDPHGQLRVYNAGVFVREYFTSMFDMGGLIVTRVPIGVNNARNDVERSDPTWRGIVRTVNAHLNRGQPRKPTGAALKPYAQKLLRGEPDEQLMDLNLFQDITGKKFTLRRLLSRLSSVRAVLAEQDEYDEKVTAVHRANAAFVFHPGTLELFGVDRVETLISALERASLTLKFYMPPDLKTFATVDEAMPSLTGETRPKLDLDKPEHHALMSLREALRGTFGTYKIAVGVSDTLDTWHEQTNRTLYVADRVLHEGMASADALAQLGLRLMNLSLERQISPANVLRGDAGHTLFKDLIAPYVTKAAARGVTLDASFLTGPA